jgi:hypothetical protein
MLNLLHRFKERKLCPTVCVTCVWAGVDSAWEQEKLEARKILEIAQTPTRQVHALLGNLLAYQNAA